MKFVLASVLLIFGVSLNDANAASLPNDPIVDQGVPACHTYEFLEGSEACAFLEKLGEPPLPLTRPNETKLAIRLWRGVGERGPVIVLRAEFINESRALLKAYESSPNGSFLLVEGSTWLNANDISVLLKELEHSNFWSLPEKSAPLNSVAKNDETQRTIVVCQAALIIAGMKAGARHVVDRNCPGYNADDREPLAIWNAFFRVAQAHFTDLGQDRLWREESK